jgi:hypothetical protein
MTVRAQAALAAACSDTSAARIDGALARGAIGGAK